MGNAHFLILTHTADLRLQILGQSKKELFRHALEGMFLSAKPLEKKGGKKISRAFQVSSPDVNALLVDFLNEALTLADTYNEIYHDAEIKNFRDDLISGEFVGHSREQIRLEIKAATHHEVNIQKVDGRWQTNIVFDI